MNNNPFNPPKAPTFPPPSLGRPAPPPPPTIKPGIPPGAWNLR